MQSPRILFALFVPLLSLGQIGVPDSAHVNLYFPHFADGGPDSQQWQTKFTFVNPNAFEVAATLRTL